MRTRLLLALLPSFVACQAAPSPATDDGEPLVDTSPPADTAPDDTSPEDTAPTDTAPPEDTAPVVDTAPPEDTAPVDTGEPPAPLNRYCSR